MNVILHLLIIFGIFTVKIHCRLSFPLNIKQESANCPPQPDPSTLPSPLPIAISNALEDIGRLGANVLDNNTIPGITIGVTYNGETIYSKGLGVKSKENKTPPDANTIFRIGSVSKIFPVTMVYQLFEAGLINSLDDPIAKYVPEFKVLNPFSKSKITIRQMASQMSGLQRETPCKESEGTINQCQVDNEDILNILSTQNLIHPPWTTPSYSNLAYALLGRLLVSLADKNMSFEEYVRNNISNPLGLRSTGFTITEQVKARMAVGYMLDGSKATLVDIGWESPAGQMYSTINDLNKLSSFFYEAYPNKHGTNQMNDESVLEAAIRREMSLPYYINPDKRTGFGTPWEILYRGNYTIRTKGGNINGYSAIFSFIPELHLGINALFSGEFESAEFIGQAYDTLLPPLVEYLSNIPTKIRFPPDPEPYVGTFIGGNVEVITFVQNNVIYARSTGNPTMIMDYWDTNELQIYFNQSMYPCFQNEIYGELGEWIYYDANYEDFKSPGFEIPGMYPGIVFNRIL